MMVGVHRVMGTRETLGMRAFMGKWSVSEAPSNEI